MDKKLPTIFHQISQDDEDWIFMSTPETLTRHLLFLRKASDVFSGIIVPSGECGLKIEKLKSDLSDWINKLDIQEERKRGQLKIAFFYFLWLS